VQADQGRDRRWDREALHLLGPILAGLAAALGVFAAVAASLYLPHGSPPSATQYAWAILASAITGALTFLQVRKTAVGNVAGQRTHLQRTEAPLQVTRQEALAQLPPDIHDFTGRDQPVGQIQDLLTGSPQAPSRTSTVVVSAIAGKPGVGKTTLAVHVAHRLRPHFPDGQLYVNLRGPEAQPLEPARVWRIQPVVATPRW